ncbi:MAG: hypothetical protein K5622_03450, partial [Endomicrobiaceae bacterium]|nr:hypothetical protein [Endomicrobiaceae bacterium]
RIALDSTNYKSFINYGIKIFEFIKYLKEQKFCLYSSSCGHFIRDIFTKEQEHYLKQNIHNFKYNDCSKNYPLDVLPDGTVIPCVSFADRNKQINFLKYNSLKELKLKISTKFNFDKIKYKNCMANKY